MARHAKILMFVSVAGLSVGVAAVTAVGQAWSFDDINSTLDLQAEAVADEYTTPDVVTAADTTDVFIPGYVGSQYTYDWGNGVNPVARDDPPDLPIVVSSSGGLVGIRGVGTNVLKIRWKTTTLLDSEFSEGFDGSAWATAVSNVIGSIDGLTPFSTYTLLYDWELFAQAVTDHEGAGEDPEYAAGSLTFDFGGFGPGLIFDEEVNSDDPDLFGLLDLSGGGSIDFIPVGSSVWLSVDVDAIAEAAFAMPAPGAGDDLAGSQFVGELTLTVVPEPGTVLLLGVGVLLGVRRRR